VRVAHGLEGGDAVIAAVHAALPCVDGDLLRHSAAFLGELVSAHRAWVERSHPLFSRFGEGTGSPWAGPAPQSLSAWGVLFGQIGTQVLGCSRPLASPMRSLSNTRMVNSA
jgi:hypothetical protein